jgi:DNA-binding NarL/FixJ family response regulator
MSQKSILIVDDSRIIVDRLLQMLKGLKNIGPIGHAGNYSTAVSFLAESRSDLVLLDINLPDRSGIALLQFIKSAYPNIIVIMITNQADDYYRNICQRMGADYFIDKSRDFEQIPVIISSLL